MIDDQKERDAKREAEAGESTISCLSVPSFDFISQSMLGKLQNGIRGIKTSVSTTSSSYARRD
jgi:hypothetical protein